MMTSVAFILGVLPLAVAHGAGAEMRQALGMAVLGGMLGVTVFGIFLTPVFFALMDRVTKSRVAQNRWVVAVSAAGMYVLRLKFLRRWQTECAPPRRPASARPRAGSSGREFGRVGQVRAVPPHLFVAPVSRPVKP